MNARPVQRRVPAATTAAAGLRWWPVLSLSPTKRRVPTDVLNPTRDTFHTRCRVAGRTATAKGAVRDADSASRLVGAAALFAALWSSRLPRVREEKPRSNSLSARLTGVACAERRAKIRWPFGLREL